MPIGTVESRVDVQFEVDVADVERSLETLRNKPLALSAYKGACVSIRQAEHLLSSIDGNNNEGQFESADRLLQLAREAVRIANNSESRIPASSLDGFKYVQSSLQRHLVALEKHICNSAS